MSSFIYSEKNKQKNIFDCCLSQYLMEKTIMVRNVSEMQDLHKPYIFIQIWTKLDEK